MNQHQQEQETKLIELHRIIDSLKNSVGPSSATKSSEKASLQKIPSQIDNMESEESSLLESSQLGESQLVLKEGDAEMEDHSELIDEEQKQEDDIDMTDEEEEQRKKLEDMLKRRRTQEELMTKEVLLTSAIEQATKDLKSPLEEDLEKLIKENGEDIEFEFYFNGKVIPQTQTIYDIIQESSNKQKKPDDNKYTSGLFGSMFQESTIHFLIKDKGDELKMSRKDSIMEFTQKRERTRSEAVNDLSNSSVNYLVQELIEREFKIFKETSHSSLGKGAELASRKNSIIAREKE